MHLAVTLTDECSFCGHELTEAGAIVKAVPQTNAGICFDCTMKALDIFFNQAAMQSPLPIFSSLKIADQLPNVMLGRSAVSRLLDEGGLPKSGLHTAEDLTTAFLKGVEELLVKASESAEVATRIKQIDAEIAKKTEDIRTYAEGQIASETNNLKKERRKLVREQPKYSPPLSVFR